MIPRLSACALAMAMLLTGCTAPAPTYPDSYLLQDDEMPAGAQNAPPFGGFESPHQATEEELEEMRRQIQESELEVTAPVDMWSQLIMYGEFNMQDEPDTASISVPRWETATERDKAVDLYLQGIPGAEPCPEDHRLQLWQDTTVLVTFAGEPRFVEPAVSAVTKKTPSLTLVDDNVDC